MTGDAFGERPRLLIRDQDSKFGRLFQRVAASTNIEILLTPPQSPQANVICERFWGSLRREGLDSFILLGERYPRRIVGEYVRYFN